MNFEGAIWATKKPRRGLRRNFRHSQYIRKYHAAQAFCWIYFCSIRPKPVLAAFLGFSIRPALPGAIDRLVDGRQPRQGPIYPRAHVDPTHAPAKR